MPKFKQGDIIYWITASGIKAKMYEILEIEDGSYHLKCIFAPDYDSWWAAFKVIDGEEENDTKYYAFDFDKEVLGEENNV